MLTQPLCMLPLSLLFIFLLLKLHGVHLATATVAGEGIIRDGQSSQISRVRLPGDERMRGGLQDNIVPQARRTTSIKVNVPRQENLIYPKSHISLYCEWWIEMYFGERPRGPLLARFEEYATQRIDAVTIAVQLCCGTHGPASGSIASMGSD